MTTAPQNQNPSRWDPPQYQRFSSERSRPFFDLLARVPDDNVFSVADLGCGAGELTRRLLMRWPGAAIWGVDSSPEMLAAAAKLPQHRNLHFVEADLTTWQPDKPLDRIISNAALQWVPDHASLLKRLVGLLAPRGVLAMQMPRNFDEPAHRILAEVAVQEPWASALGGRAERYFVETPAWYAETLHGLGLDVDLWETIYYHVLAEPEAVLEWMKGTALRPILTRLSEDQHEQFLAVYGSKLRAAYPASRHGTLFPFRRLFFVARLRT
ncbi:MAG: methyltransferase domain-containing protein [Deltaproteobacteria bacterium]|nr:methyltransferase domain-containing protein [Deltaproteobacteria bacterium]